MSYEVEKAFWYHWQPGEAYDANDPERGEYLRWVRRNQTLVHKTLLALAFDANPIGFHGDQALTWAAVPTIAQRIRRSDRQTQRILHALDQAGEIGIDDCDGRLCPGKHYGTNHFILYKPKGAPRWGDPEPVRRKRGSSRRKKK